MAERKLHRYALMEAKVSYYLYAPKKVNTGVPIFITVHGWSRNVLEHAKEFLSFAEEYGVVLVAPLFDPENFPQYQRLGHSSKKGRADRALDAVIAEVVSKTGAEPRPLYMFGFSGGGQFVQRYAMVYPEKVKRIALGAPGWFTFPDPDQHFPYGLGPNKRLPDIHPEPHRFLKVPAKVMVGDLDVHRDHHLNTSRAIDRAQGTNRMERATHWVQAMNAAARACDYKTKYTLEILKNSEHSFTMCMENGRMGQKVFRFLFGARK